ncbi:MAG: Fe-S cluster assembly protein SufD [Bacteroidota bacterium]|nr:Fe-S cluster assembly protein SufD [Bacteroidota bacterium]
MNQSFENIKQYIEQFEAFEKTLNGESKTPFHEIRRGAIEQFSKLGFPTAKDEEWRFTNIQPIIKTKFKTHFNKKIEAVRKEQIEKVIIKGIAETRLVFINGYYSDEYSINNITNKDIKVGCLSETLQNNFKLIRDNIAHISKYDKNVFTSLNTSFIHDGAFIFVPDDTTIEEPIYIVYISSEDQTPFITHPRNLIIVGQHSKVSVVEHFVHLSDNIYFNNAVTEIAAGENSIIEHTKLQSESAKAYHIGTTYIHQSKGSKVTQNSIMIGGAIVRNNIISILEDEGIECTLNGLSLATGQQLIDNHTTIDHSKPHCASHELYKAILDGKSKGVFNGKIYVRKDAQKTDAKQTNKTLLLSDEAAMDTKPQLEIFADDVKCTHGAAIGYIDADALFYLRSRGISEEIARDLLTYAFADDIIEKLCCEQIREYLHRILHSRLKQGRELEKL